MTKRPRRVVVVGDAVLDRDAVGTAERLCPDAPVPVVDVSHVGERPGGAALAAVLCAADRATGHEVHLVAAVGADEAGSRLTALLQKAGVMLHPLHQTGPTRTKTRVRCRGQSLLRLDDGGPAHPVGEAPGEALQAIAEAGAILVSDYGTGTASHPGIRQAL